MNEVVANYKKKKIQAFLELCVFMATLKNNQFWGISTEKINSRSIRVIPTFTSNSWNFVHFLSANIAKFSLYRFFFCPTMRYWVLKYFVQHELSIIQIQMCIIYLDNCCCHTHTRIGGGLETFVVNKKITNWKIFNFNEASKVWALFNVYLFAF